MIYVIQSIPAICATIGALYVFFSKDNYSKFIVSGTLAVFYLLLVLIVGSPHHLFCFTCWAISTVLFASCE
jgi:hypothetical protein